MNFHRTCTTEGRFARSHALRVRNLDMLLHLQEVFVDVDEDNVFVVIMYAPWAPTVTLVSLI
jgi:hypothetical protein